MVKNNTSLRSLDTAWHIPSSLICCVNVVSSLMNCTLFCTSSIVILIGKFLFTEKYQNIRNSLRIYSHCMKFCNYKHYTPNDTHIFPVNAFLMSTFNMFKGLLNRKVFRLITHQLKKDHETRSWLHSWI